MRLKAKMAFVYGGKRIATGEAFEAPDKDAELLVRVGRAGKEPMRFPDYETRVEAPIDAEVTDEAPKKRQYRRRDLTAEE